MSGETQLTLIASVLAFAASVISTLAILYTGRLARFRGERWWERKAEAYGQIVEALAEMVEYYRVTYTVEIEGNSITDARRREISTRWRKGWEEIRRATNVGAFLISRESTDILKDLWRSSQQAPPIEDWPARIEHDYDSAQRCMTALVSAARRDLGIAD